MKNITIIIINVLLGFAVTGSLMVIGGRMSRAAQLDGGLSSAVEESVETILSERNYDVGDRDEFVADLVEDLSGILDNESVITVEIGKADAGLGVMSVRVAAEFVHPNGRTDTAECERTVIFNRSDDPEPRIWSVDFYKTREDMEAGRYYMSYQVADGDTLSGQGAPASDGAVFSGWRDSGDAPADFSVPVTQDLAFYAEWH